MGRTGGPNVQNGNINPMASRAGVPHTAPHGVMVLDAFPSFPPNKKKTKKNYILATISTFLLVNYSCDV